MTVSLPLICMYIPSQLVVIYDLHRMSYGQYCELKGNASESEDEEVSHFAQLVGRTCAERMFLIR